MCDDEREELLKGLREVLGDLERVAGLGLRSRPDKYYPDGSPIIGDELLPAELKWAALFEAEGKIRIIGRATTIYGEMLSTVWLGIDHNFSRIGPPLIYETMLFAPRDKEAQHEYVKNFMGKGLPPEKQTAYDREQEYIEKHFPHDQLQLRYSTRREAEDSHNKLKLQCLIPPRWRHFLLGRVFCDPTWLDYDEEVFE